MEVQYCCTVRRWGWGVMFINILTDFRNGSIGVPVQRWGRGGGVMCLWRCAYWSRSNSLSACMCVFFVIKR
jgi:hypothetical protein